MRILLYTSMTLCLTVVLQHCCHCSEGKEKGDGDFHYHAQQRFLSAAVSSCNSRSSVPHSYSYTSLRLLKWWHDNSKHTVQHRCVCLCSAAWYRNPRNKNPRKSRIFQTVYNSFFVTMTIGGKKTANQLWDNIWKSVCLCLCFVCSFGGYNTLAAISDMHSWLISRDTHKMFRLTISLLIHHLSSFFLFSVLFQSLSSD